MLLTIIAGRQRQRLYCVGKDSSADEGGTNAGTRCFHGRTWKWIRTPRLLFLLRFSLFILLLPSRRYYAASDCNAWFWPASQQRLCVSSNLSCVLLFDLLRFLFFNREIVLISFTWRQIFFSFSCSFTYESQFRCCFTFIKTKWIHFSLFWSYLSLSYRYWFYLYKFSVYYPFSFDVMW